jgi:hypothetical protein
MNPGDAFPELAAAWLRDGREWSEAEFERRALELYAYQVERNEAYARFAASLGFSKARAPQSWRTIPAVPSSAFKDATLTTFPARDAELVFHTSGTTAGRAGKHYVQRAALYDASLLAAFDRFMLTDRPRLRFLNLVPNPRFNPHSSLGYMLGHAGVLRGEGPPAYFLDGDALDVAGFSAALETACAQNRAVLIATTAFALATLLDTLEAQGRAFAAPAGSRVMETGGFKGRAKVVAREELYARAAAALGIAQSAIVAEYGMTELLSQFYDTPASRGTAVRVKAGPPWLRTLVVDAAGNEVSPGTTGFLRHVDLANVSSVLAIDTEDRGYAVDGGFVLLGRDLDAPPRGCSLDAEELRARVAS